MHRSSLHQVGIDRDRDQALWEELEGMRVRLPERPSIWARLRSRLR